MKFPKWKKTFWIGRLLIKFMIAESGSWSTKEQEARYERIYIFSINILKHIEDDTKVLSIIIGPFSMLFGIANK